MKEWENIKLGKLQDGEDLERNGDAKHDQTILYGKKLIKKSNFLIEKSKPNE